jgi:hypothetical protein
MFPSGESGRGFLPLISFGGITTPAGALISSRTAKASPFVAEEAMSVVDAKIWVASQIRRLVLIANRKAPLRSAKPLSGSARY